MEEAEEKEDENVSFIASCSIVLLLKLPLKKENTCILSIEDTAHGITFLQIRKTPLDSPNPQHC